VETGAGIRQSVDQRASDNNVSAGLEAKPAGDEGVERAKLGNTA
jgi:hypothetical protein